VSAQPDKADLVSSESIVINEHIECNVYCLREVIIDISGGVRGNIHSKSCIVNGKVEGDILSADYIEVKNTAIIEGNIKSGSVQIEAGSVINGFVSIEKKLKLTAIIKKIAEGPDTTESESVAQKNTIAQSEEKPHYKSADSEINPAQKTQTPESNISPHEAIADATTPVAPEESDKKIEIAQKSPAKSADTTSNDSWW
jgi:cytoskeletal protein CcmA (bactofilin family)